MARSTHADGAVRRAIAEADTPEKVWALVAGLVGDANQYSPATYLQNVKAWTEVAQSMDLS